MRLHENLPSIKFNNQSRIISKNSSLERINEAIPDNEQTQNNSHQQLLRITSDTVMKQILDSHRNHEVSKFNLN